MKHLAKEWKPITLAVFCIVLGLSIIGIDDSYLGQDYPALIGIALLTVALSIGIMVKTRIDAEGAAKKIIEKVKSGFTESELKEQESYAGKVSFEGNDIIYTWGKNERLEIGLDDLSVVGEVTTDADPFAIDWYLIFVNKNEEVIFLPAYARGLKDMLEQLSLSLNIEIIPKLCASTNFNSNILYPVKMKGQPLFDFVGLEPATFWQKIKLRLGLGQVTPTLCPAVINYLRD